MLISIDWIKDFVNVPTDMTPKELGEKFTLATAEVEDVLTIGEHLEKITVVEVLEKEKHPEADKLNLVTFTNGKDNFKVVCGASNVTVGMKTAYAPLGITLPNGLTLEPKKIRGVLSEGMLCSEEELGLAEDSSGIIELDKKAPLGQTMLELFNENKDILLDVDNKSLTHRPDLWGHYGLAREFATVFKNTLKDIFTNEWEKSLRDLQTDADAPIKIKVEKDSSSLGYFGLSVDGVTVGESPQWIKKRLIAVGLRPINNIVDISNYVMLELGMPLHIFDRDKIVGDTVHIKRAGSNTTFKTLDEIDRELIDSDTVICDGEKPLVLAGIMGGLNSGVDENTKNIFIEVANWKASEVRKTSTRLGLRTDSSSRYEKTLDSLLLERTLLRTLEYVLKLCPEAKVVGKIQYDGPNLEEIKTVKIKSSKESINRALGKDVSFEEMKSIFESLDFKIDGNENSFEVTVLSFRATKDVECESCLVEEIGRVIGFDNIEEISPKLDVKPTKLTPRGKLHRRLRNFMAFNAGSYEVMTYPMIGEKLLKKAMYDNPGQLELINALSNDHSFMRTTMIPSFLEAASKNVKNVDEFKFFELGRTYHADEKNFYSEKSILGIAHFSKSKTPFMDVLNTVERLLFSMNINAQFSDRHPKFTNNIVDENWMGVHPYEFRNIRIQGKMDGVVMSVHPIVLKSFKIKGHLTLSFIDLSSFEDRELKDKVKYSPLPKFPGSDFDCTVVANINEPVENILSSLKKLKVKELTSLKIVDVFKMDEENKAVTLKASFLDKDKTLSGEIITEASNKMVDLLSKAGYPLKS